METPIKRPRIETSSSSSSRWALEIKVISGEDLRINKRQSVKNSFVVIRTDSFSSSSSSSSSSSYNNQDQRTKMDTDGGSYPAWDEKLAIDMPMHARFFTVEVQCKKNGVNRIIGTAKIPVSDFIGSLVPEKYLHFLSYRLWDPQGERNGIINLSVRVKNPGIGNHGNFAPVAGGGYSKRPWAAGVPVDAKFSYYNHGQVVTGIPVGSQNF